VGVTLACAASSCSRVVSFSVVEPGALAFVPSGSGSSKHPRVTRRDSAATAEDGLLVVSGDSLLVYSRVDAPPAPRHLLQHDFFQLKRFTRSMQVVGFVPTGSHRRDWDGDLTMAGDSLQFVRWPVSGHALTSSTVAETVLAAPSEIARVDLGQLDLGNTIGGAVIVTALIVSIVALVRTYTERLYP
jgi:hypothetical protein